MMSYLAIRHGLSMTPVHTLFNFSWLHTPGLNHHHTLHKHADRINTVKCLFSSLHTSDMPSPSFSRLYSSLDPPLRSHFLTHFTSTVTLAPHLLRVQIKVCQVFVHMGEYKIKKLCSDSFREITSLKFWWCDVTQLPINSQRTPDIYPL